jgi:predicted DNA-binding protein (MmcQ/YjbR family)
VTEYADAPAEVVAAVRPACMALPEAYEERAWAGVRWRIRTRTFAHVFDVDSAAGTTTILTFRSQGEELDVLRNSGHPFFRAGWGVDVMGMVVDGSTDWGEVAELVTESYCLLAPKKLVALVDRPAVPADEEGLG